MKTGKGGRGIIHTQTSICSTHGMRCPKLLDAVGQDSVYSYKKKEEKKKKERERAREREREREREKKKEVCLWLLFRNYVELKSIFYLCRYFWSRMTYTWRTLLSARPRAEDRATRMFISCACVPMAGCSWVLQAGTAALPRTSVEIPNSATLQELCIPAAGDWCSYPTWTVVNRHHGRVALSLTFNGLCFTLRGSWVWSSLMLYFVIHSGGKTGLSV